MIFGDSCTSCGECVAYCPVNALVEEESGVKYLFEKCVECQVCVRAKVCPEDNLKTEMSAPPRNLRHLFSDPYGKHPSTSHLGRGTEEVKTNDVTNLVEPGYVGIAVEAGRPGIGAKFADVEVITKALSKFEVKYPSKTPITSLIEDFSTGQLKKEILNEVVMSVIVEFVVPVDTFVDVIRKIYEVSLNVESTVYSVGFFLNKETVKLLPDVNTWGIPIKGISPNGKTNLGLGRR